MIKKGFKTPSIFILAEAICFLSIAAFCLGAWLTTPRIVFSLRDVLDDPDGSRLKEILSTDQLSLDDVSLPKEYYEHFETERLNALTIGKDSSLTLCLDSVLEQSGIELNQPMGLAYSAVCLNAQPGQYRTSIRYPNTRKYFAVDSPHVPMGGTVLRDCFARIDPVVPGSLLSMSVIDPSSQGYLCDFCLYDAPGLMFWERKR